MKKNIWALHGFLGQPSDWNSVFSKLCENRERSFNLELKAEDLLEYINDNDNSLSRFSKDFYRKNDRFNSEENILLGYSMGGRLALQCLFDQPNFWSKVIIISANPGLNTDEERSVRKQADLKWSDKFLENPWDKLMLEWNSQPIFTEKNFKKKSEKEFDRIKLSKMIEDWSVAKQQSFWEKLKHNETPILWLVGEKDAKYCEIADKVSSIGRNIEVVKVPDVGHRVHLLEDGENTKKLIKIITNFLKQV